jgi:hypothetical protein
MVLSSSTYITFENGSTADIASGVYNHHVAVAGLGKMSKMPFGCTFKPANQTTIIVEGNTTRVTTEKARSGLDALSGHGDGKLQPIFDPSAILEYITQYPYIQDRLSAAMDSPSPMSLIFGSGDDGAPTDFASLDPSLKAGLYLGDNVTVFQSTEMVNYRNESQVVYITADIEYMPGRPAGWKDATMGAMSATGCAGVGYCELISLKCD